MQFLEKEISQLMEAIWGEFLQIGFAPNPDGAPPGGRGLDITSCLHITGAWDGVVALRCSQRLAQQVAGTLFDVPAPETTEDQITDAIGELTNMTGGNLKALLTPPCVISLPIITKQSGGPVRVPGSRQVSELAFKAAGQDFVITILEREAIPADK